MNKIYNLQEPTSNTLLSPIIIILILELSEPSTFLLIITVCSSIKLFSPIIIGPASAIIFTLGWINVRDAFKWNIKNLQNMFKLINIGNYFILQIVTSPIISTLSSQTNADLLIVYLI